MMWKKIGKYWYNVLLAWDQAWNARLGGSYAIYFYPFSWFCGGMASV